MEKNNVNLDTRKLGSADLASIAKVFDWLSNNPKNEVEEIGWNENSGNVYAVLESGYIVYSSFGQSVDFMDMDENEVEEQVLIDSVKE